MQHYLSVPPESDKVRGISYQPLGAGIIISFFFYTIIMIIPLCKGHKHTHTPSFTITVSKQLHNARSSLTTPTERVTILRPCILNPLWVRNSMISTHPTDECFCDSNRLEGSTMAVVSRRGDTKPSREESEEGRHLSGRTSSSNESLSSDWIWRNKNKPCHIETSCKTFRVSKYSIDQTLYCWMLLTGAQHMPSGKYCFTSANAVKKVSEPACMD